MLYLARHGSTILNPGDPEDPKPYHRGWAEEQLSDLGKVSSTETAEWLKSQPLDYIVSSPLQRAKQSADIISQITNVPVLKLDIRLITWNVGAFAGHLVTAETQGLLNMYQYELPDAKIPFGEPYNTFIERWTRGLKFWLEKSKDKDILLMTHHRPILTVPTALWGKPAKKGGPPEPSGVMLLENKELVEMFESPTEKEYAHGAPRK